MSHRSPDDSRIPDAPRRHGACHCQSLRFETHGPELAFYACHCTDCQTASGSAFGLSMLFRRDQIELIQGELGIDEYPRNGHQIRRHHCRTCGTTLWFSSVEYEDYATVRAGVFEDTSELVPRAHVWVRSAQPWVRLDPDVPSYETQPEISELLKA